MGQLYVFSGTLAVAPGATPTTLQVTVTGGNRPALRALVGNTTTPLTFAVDSRTSYIAWTAGDRANAPSSTTPDMLKAGDPVHLRIRAPWGTPLATLLTTPVRMVNDFAAAQRVAGRLFLFEGRAVAVDTTAKTITIDVRFGNWFALNAMLGQPTTETFHYDASTLFLSWNHRAPHTFDPSQIVAGDLDHPPHTRGLRHAARDPARGAALEGQRPRARQLARQPPAARSRWATELVTPPLSV